jgi:hypothetical protein
LKTADEVLPDMPDPLADAVGTRLLFEAMLNRLREKRLEGRHGWHKPEVCSVEDLEEMFDKAWTKNPTNWLDIATFAMMIWHRRKHE